MEIEEPLMDIEPLARKCPICIWLLIEQGKFKEKSKDFDVYEGLELEDHLAGNTHTKREIASLITEKLFESKISDPTED